MCLRTSEPANARCAATHRASGAKRRGGVVFDVTREHRFLIALDVKPFDALMLSVFIILVAATVHAVGRFLPGHRTRD